MSLTDGSFAMLVGHYVAEAGLDVCYDTNPVEETPCCYLIGHEGKFDSFDFNMNSVVVDPWRSFSTKRNDLTVIWFGNTRAYS